MIRVNMADIEIEGNSDIITAELGILLHAFRKDYPVLFLQALTAEDILYKVQEEGK